LALELAYVLCVTWMYRTHTVRSPVYRSAERMFPKGTFAQRSENAGERKVPESVQHTYWIPKRTRPQQSKSMSMDDVYSSFAHDLLYYCLDDVNTCHATLSPSCPTHVAQMSFAQSP